MTVVRLRPRYESANIRTWVGFRQFLYLVEEALLAWFRERNHGPWVLYHRYGLGLEVVDCSLLLPATLEVDDVVAVDVTALPVTPTASLASLDRSDAFAGRFAVRMRVERDAGPAAVIARGKVTVVLVHERGAPGAQPNPAWLSPMVVPELTGPDGDAPTEDAAFAWDWRARYFHCHYSDRVQFAAYAQALEEVVDRFLADRGLSVPRMLAERAWIPVVSRVRLRLLADARMGEMVHTTFRVCEVVKSRAFDGRMDCVVDDHSGPRHVATATILHGYAIGAGDGAGTLAELDETTAKALLGSTDPRPEGIGRTRRVPR